MDAGSITPQAAVEFRDHMKAASRMFRSLLEASDEQAVDRVVAFVNTLSALQGFADAVGLGEEDEL